MLIGNNINFDQNQLINGVVERRNTPPPTPVEGQFYYDTVKDSFGIFNGTTWRYYDISQIPPGSIPISKLAVNPLLRSNHVGTMDYSAIGNPPPIPVVAALAQTYTSGTVFLYGGSNVTLSTDGQSISIIAAAGGGGGNANISISGNTAGVPTLISSGTFYLAGGNNITLSQNGNSVSIIASSFSQSVQTQGTFNTTQLNDYLGTAYTSHSHSAYINTSVSSIFQQTSNNSLYQLTANNSLSLGTDYTTHTHNQYINTSVSSNFQQTTNNSLFQLTANNSLSLGTDYTSHTHSQYINTSVSSNFLTTQTSAVFSNSNNVTFGVNAGTITASASFSQSVQTQNLVSINGSTGNVSFSNANGITFGANASTITASHNGITSQSNPAFSASGSSSTFQTLAFGNSNGVSFSISNGSLVGSVQTNYQSSNANYLTSQSNQAFSASGGSSAFQTLNFENSNGVTFTNTNGSVAITHALQYTSNTSAITASAFNTSGSSNFLLTANSSLLQHTSATSAITSNALHSSASRVFNIVAATNNTGGGTASLSSNVSLSNANGVSFYTSAGGAIVASVQTNYQSSNANYLTSQSNQALSGSNGSFTFQTATFGSSNGMHFYTTNGSIVGSYTVPTIPGATVFSNSNNVSFGLNGSTVTATATFSQSVQTQNLHNVTLSGNTAGVMAQVSSGTLTIAGGNNITISQNGNAITISGANVGGAQTGISGIIASNATYTSGTVSFADGNGISFGTGVGQQVSIIHGLQFTSNTSAITSNAFNTSGSSNFLLTANSSLLQHTSATSAITSNAVHTTAARIQGIIGSDTTYTSGSVSLRDLNGISWQSTTGQAYQITHALQYTSNTSNITSNAFNTSGSSNFVLTANSSLLQHTSATSNITSNALNTSVSRVINIIAATNNTGGGTASLSSNVSFSNANGLTFYTSAGGAVVGSYTVPAVPSAYVSSLNGSSGAISLNAGSSLSASTNGSSITFGLASNITTALQSAGNYLTTAALSSQTLAFTLSGNSATTNSSQILNGGFALAGGNGVTLQQSNNTISISVATNYQSQAAYLTTARASNDAVGLNTAATNVTWTVNSSGISLNAGAYLTTAMQSNAGSNFVAATAAFAGTNASGTIASNGISISVNPGGGGGIAASISGNSTSAGAGYSNITSGTMIIAGGPNITLSQNGSIISISANNPGAAAENNWVNLLGANTSGNTTASGSTIGYSGINLTLSGTNGSVVNISAPATSSLVGTGQLSISLNGSTISLGVPNNVTMSRFYGWPYGQISSSGMTNSQMSFRYFSIDAAVSFSRVEIPINVSLTSSATAATANIVFTSGAAIYSANGSTLNPIVGHTGNTTYTWASNNTGFSSIIGGRYATFPLATMLTPGEYWLGAFLSTNNNSSIGTATTQLANTISVFVGSFLTAQNFADFGATTGVSSEGIVRMQGLVSLSISNTTQTFQQSQITASGAQGMRGNILFNLRNL